MSDLEIAANIALVIGWLGFTAWATRKNDKDKPGTAKIKYFVRWFVTGTLVGAIVMAGFALLMQETKPTTAPPAQESTVFDRAQKYD